MPLCLRATLAGLRVYRSVRLPLTGAWGGRPLGMDKQGRGGEGGPTCIAWKGGGPPQFFLLDPCSNLQPCATLCCRQLPCTTLRYRVLSSPRKGPAPVHWWRSWTVTRPTTLPSPLTLFLSVKQPYHLHYRPPPFQWIPSQQFEPKP